MSAASPVASLSLPLVPVFCDCGSDASACATEWTGWGAPALADWTPGAGAFCALVAAGVGCAWTACGATAGAEGVAAGAG